MGGGRRIQPRGARFRLTGAYSGHGAPNSAKGAGIGASRPVAAMINGVGSGLGPGPRAHAVARGRYSRFTVPLGTMAVPMESTMMMARR